MKSLFVLALFVLSGGVCHDCYSAERADSTYASHGDGEREERRIETVVVSTDMPKSYIDKKHIPVAVSQLRSEELERERVLSIKDLSAIVPNFYQPDYGSKMTSSIYVRGFGARIDQPVIGVSVDGVPYLNKNNYDFDMLDVAAIEMLRGPQGTLFGRNTMGGQLNIYTLSPLGIRCRDAVRASAEYGSGNTVRARASYYRNGGRFGFMAGGYYTRTDGFFDNEYDGSDCDRGQGGGGRVRVAGDLGRGWSLDNTLSVGYDDEGGYAYSLYDVETGAVHGVAYNSPSRYERLNVTDGLILRRRGRKAEFSSTTGYQYTHDRMNIDNDFTTASLFTLLQEQHEHALTEDLVLRTYDEKRRWQWITGAYGFYKSLKMNAPVTFMQDGIDRLILAAANKGIQSVMPFAKLELEESEFDIASNFDIPTYGLAVYHESSLRAGERWRFTAGLRLDYESTRMDYDNYTAVNYRLTPMMRDYKQIEVPFAGREKLDYLELLPKFSVNFSTGAGDLYATVTRGYKAGGFNTQIFSDILQNKMMTAMMADMMSQMRPRAGGESPYDAASVTTYDPEYSWNYELGGHLRLAEGLMYVDFAAFWIECRDQQLTVFPEGTTTGRMMSNAGRSRSRGAELSVNLLPMRDLSIKGNYGYTNAKFVEFDDGKENYEGKYLPYAPQHTVSAGVSYDWHTGRRAVDRVVFDCTWQGAGKIYWNESNTLSQNFYSQLGASVKLCHGDFALTLWGRNLLNEDFYTFYFKSVNNNFFSHGKPRRVGITLSYTM